jgi:hypothetical protein
MEGLEPTLSEENRILSPVRLPFRHMPGVATLIHIEFRIFFEGSEEMDFFEGTGL